MFRINILLIGAGLATIGLPGVEAGIQNKTSFDLLFDEGVFSFMSLWAHSMFFSIFMFCFNFFLLVCFNSDSNRIFKSIFNIKGYFNKIFIGYYYIISYFGYLIVINNYLFFLMILMFIIFYIEKSSIAGVYYDFYIILLYLVLLQNAISVFLFAKIKYTRKIINLHLGEDFVKHHFINKWPTGILRILLTPAVGAATLAIGDCLTPVANASEVVITNICSKLVNAPILTEEETLHIMRRKSTIRNMLIAIENWTK
jgi:hypothetical protein